MNHIVILQAYTIMTLGASIFLWFLVPSVSILPSMEGMSLYLVNPFVTAELFLMLSIVVVWVATMFVSLYHLGKQKILITKMVTRNWFKVSLALATVIVAISGCIVFSEPVHLGIPLPNLFSFIYGYGALFCEGAWIIIEATKFLERLEMRLRLRLKH